MGTLGSVRFNENIIHRYPSQSKSLKNTHMKGQQIYARYIKLLQRIVCGLHDILRIAINDTTVIVVVADLGRDEDLVTLVSALALPAKQLFVVIVDVGGVPESAPVFVSSIQNL
jgi:hypothetical protein